MKTKGLLKFVALTVMLSFFCATAKADVIVQKDTVSGLVIDKKKQPLPGAKVEVVGQPYSTYTDLDGKFLIKCDPGAKKVLVTYPRTDPAKKKIKPDMTIKMGGSWSAAPQSYQWFVGAAIGLGMSATNLDETSGLNYDQDGFVSPSFSVMVGRMKNIGWYAKYFVQPFSIRINGDDTDFPDGRCFNNGVIVGGLFRLNRGLHAYLGAGFEYTKFDHIPDNYYGRYGWEAEIGFLQRYGDHWGFNFGVSCGMDKGFNYISASFLNLGVSYFFNK